MSADFNTKIHLSGEQNGIIKILKIVRDHELARNQCKMEKDCYDYLEFVNICEGSKFENSKSVRLNSVKDIKEYVKGLKTNELCIEAMGPYGRFETLEGISLYDDMSQIVNDEIDFEGYSFGFDNIGNQSLNVRYKNGVLQKEYSIDDDIEEDVEEDRDYCVEVYEIRKKMPLEVFKAIFKIDAKITEEEYLDQLDYLLDETVYYNSFGSKEIFEEWINEDFYSDNEYTISDVDFEKGLKKIEETGIRKYHISN